MFGAELTCITGLRKLEDWGSEDELGPTLTATDKFSNRANNNGRAVAPKHMFALFVAPGSQRGRKRAPLF